MLCVPRERFGLISNKMKIATWIAYETVTEGYPTFLCGGAHSSTAGSDAPWTTASSSPPIMKISCFPNLIRETFKCPLSTSEYLVLQKGNWLFFSFQQLGFNLWQNSEEKCVLSREFPKLHLFYEKYVCFSLRALFHVSKPMFAHGNREFS